mmetsp:Transcript_9338/g.30724  ORF Transcript_9338/g.30724 Transcript_9338/m.30724 type:complete len:225 (+) Transcript_9338:299-973(+)
MPERNPLCLEAPTAAAAGMYISTPYNIDKAPQPAAPAPGQGAFCARVASDQARARIERASPPAAVAQEPQSVAPPMSLLEARAALVAAWEDASNDNAGGFRLWWNMADPATKMKLLRGARNLLERRLRSGGINSSTLLLLCPELADGRLSGMISCFPGFVEGRAKDVQAFKVQDRAFIAGSCSPSVDTVKVETTVYNRQLMMAIFLTCALALFKHFNQHVIPGC